MSRNWKYIMLHHSLCKDDATRDWDALRHYHMSWRYNGVTITKEYAQKLIQKGVSGVLKPWQDIGYHRGIQFDGTQYVIKEGRPLSLAGAHCVEGGMNMLAIGVIFIGNFDINPPNIEQLKVGAAEIHKLAMEFNMGKPIDYLKYHNEFAPYKSCVGKFFPNKEEFSKFIEVSCVSI